MPSYKLTYFNIRGRAEVSRMLFELAGQEYEDVRLTGEEWQKIKPTMPFGQMPILEVDGVTIAQSRAIERLLAKRFGFYGKTDLDEARADMVIDGIVDLGNGLLPLRKLSTDEEKAAFGKKYLTEEMPAHLERLEKCASDEGYFVGNGINVADIVFENAIQYLNDMKMPVTLDKYTNLSKVRGNVVKHPKLVEYLEKRLVTPM